MATLTRLELITPDITEVIFTRREVEHAFKMIEKGDLNVELWLVVDQDREVLAYGANVRVLLGTFLALWNIKL